MNTIKTGLHWAAALLLLGGVTTASLTLGADENKSGQHKPTPCSSNGHRAFDFWLGEWEVRTPAKRNWTAFSSITSANNGCSIHESYLAPSGYAGKSINFYDARKHIWHQTWIDNQGAPLYLEGKFINSVMVLSDASNRVSWSLLPDQRVRQHWQSTEDGGKTWATVFDGYYSRRTPPSGDSGL